MANNLEREFCSYEQALALKELGFEWQTLNFFDSTTRDFWNWDYFPDINAPLKQQVFRWFREKYNLWSSIHPEVYSKEWNYHVQEWSNTEHWGELWQGDSWDTYEEAENACIDKLIEIAKQQDNESNSNRD